MKTDSFWYDLYAAAMLEFDRAALPSKIEAARTAIRQAMEEATANHCAGTPVDPQVMSDALRNLQTLQHVELRTSQPMPMSTTSQGQSLVEG